MRQKNETATSFKELKEIVQIMQARQTPTPQNNALNAQSTPKPKTRAHAKKGVLKPTKKAKRTKQGDNANAFKSDEANTRGQK
ncbi:hypothetical protein [Helicobacter pylori]|uniref:hypothetical protein n=1 Tax=Helicobacter pylori TaxID=210 RepID=UPI000C308067|nr:hypothetical protein [Helicobacter pylori]